MEYYGKVLLFGEHIVVQGAPALAVPLYRYSGRWLFSSALDKKLADLQSSLRDWLGYLLLAQQEGKLGIELNLGRFEDDLNRGLYFESTIPIGYGAGSSGALCAAFYETYGVHPVSKEDEFAYAEVRVLLGRLESFFHGASSGADPIVSYLNRPLLFDKDKSVRAVSRPESHPGYKLFLLDTGRARRTEPLVEAFRKWCMQPDYLSRVMSELIPTTEEAIHAYLGGYWTELYEAWEAISHFQYRYMQDMILPEWRSSWLESLAAKAHCLKICGAGGGGFMLGLSRDWDYTLSEFGDLVKALD